MWLIKVRSSTYKPRALQNPPNSPKPSPQSGYTTLLRGCVSPAYVPTHMPVISSDLKLIFASSCLLEEWRFCATGSANRFCWGFQPLHPSTRIFKLLLQRQHLRALRRCLSCHCIQLTNTLPRHRGCFHRCGRRSNRHKEILHRTINGHYRSKHSLRCPRW